MTIADVAKVLGVTGIKKLVLGPLPTSPILCGTVFFGGFGASFVTVTEWKDGPGALRRLRKAKAKELGSESIQPAAALGPGAFLARGRFLAFGRGTRVVSVESEYDQQGKLTLTVSQLERLARVLATRL